MENLSEWTYAGHQQTFEDWLSSVRRLDKTDDNYFGVNDAEASALTSYFNDTTLLANVFAHSLLSSEFGSKTLQNARNTQDVNQIADKRIDCLLAVLASLPATHARICDLLNAVQALKDDELGFTSEQLIYIDEWGPIIRLNRFIVQVSDHSQGMETFDQEQWRNEQAFFAYYATQGKPEYLQDGYWVFKDYLGPRVEVTDLELQGAAYWLIRATPALHAQCMASSKNTHSMADWQGWKETMGKLLYHGDRDSPTVEIVKFALERMEKAENQ